MSALPELGIPGLLLADSYKASHYYMVRTRRLQFLGF